MIHTAMGNPRVSRSRFATSLSLLSLLVIWTAAQTPGLAQQADYRALRLMDEAIGCSKSGQAELALAKLREVTSSGCCARFKAMALAWVGRIHLERGDVEAGLSSYRESLMYFDQGFADATAAKSEVKQSSVMSWRVRTVRRMLEARPPPDEIRRLYALAREYLELSKTVAMQARDKLELEQDMREVEQLWAGLARRYADVVDPARELYTAQAYQDCLNALRTLSGSDAPPDATELDRAEACHLSGLSLCRMAVQEPDDAQSEGLMSWARDLFMRTDACSAASRQEEREAVHAAAERLGSRQFAATLEKARQLYDNRAYGDCLQVLDQWVSTSEPPKGASALQAAEGYCLVACCICRRATDELNQAQFEEMLRQARLLAARGGEAPDEARAECDLAINDAVTNRYRTRLQEARQLYRGGQYQECLTKLDLWAHVSPLPEGATEWQNAEGFHLRALSLCKLALAEDDDDAFSKLINDAKLFFRYNYRLAAGERDEGRLALAAALDRSGRKHFAQARYGPAYLSLRESYDLQENLSLRFLLAECHRLDPEGSQPYIGPAFLRDCIFVYQQIMADVPDTTEAKESARWLPEVIRRCNQTALLQLDPEPWQGQAERVECQITRCLKDYSGTWWRPEGTAGKGPGFIFDSVIEATTVADALADARERGNLWLLRLAGPEFKQDPAGILVATTFTVEAYDALDETLAGSTKLAYEAARVDRRDEPGVLADRVLRPLRDNFVADASQKLPCLLGDNRP